MLVERGFDRDAAVQLYVEATQIVIGAVVCAERRRVLAASGPADADALEIPATVGDHRITLERLIRDVERERDTGSDHDDQHPVRGS